MSVYENLLMGANGRGRNKDLASDLDRVFELFPILKSRRGQLREPYPGESSRCSPWAGQSFPGPGY